MNSVQERLDPKRFVRIHRSTIVNVEKVKELRPWPTGEYVSSAEGKSSPAAASQRNSTLGEARKQASQQPLTGSSGL